MVNEEIVLYGAGIKGGIDFYKATDMNIPVKAFVDRKAQEKMLYKGIKVYKIEEAIALFRENIWVISIGDEVIKAEVKDMLQNKGIKVYGSIEDYYVGPIDYSVVLKAYGQKEYSFKVAVNYIPDNPLAYSFGIGGDWTFETDVCSINNGKVYMFDPSPSVVLRMKDISLPKNLRFEGIGLSNKDGKSLFHIPRVGEDYSEANCQWVKEETVELPAYRLITIMNKLGHTHLNLLKMDIEGSEFFVLPDITASSIKIDQICLETHGRIFCDSVSKMREIKKVLNEKGFLLVSNEMYEQTYVNIDILERVDSDIMVGKDE